MPAPKEGEDRDTFVSRCVPIVLDDGTAENADQAVAICNSMWEEAQKSDDTTPQDRHGTFIVGLSERNKSSDFGYGITTAEPYVRSVLQLESAGCKTGRTEPAEAMLKDAAGKLCAAFPEMVVEKLATVAESDAIGLGGTQPPPKTLMLIRHVLTTDREDRDGDILRTAGAALDPKAPLLWQHQPFLPIGRVMRTVEHTASKLTVVSALLDLNELTSDVAKLIEADALRFSHGFRVLDYEPRKSADGTEGDGFEVTKFEILEASLVSVPSNIDAEIELYSRGRLESDLAKAHARQFLSERQVVVKGVDVDAEGNVVPDEPAKQMQDEDEEEETDDEDKDEERSVEATGTKAGRVLSQRNMEVLQEVVADLEELSSMDMSRSAKALCDRCIDRLQKVLDAAKPLDEEKSSTDIVLTDVVNFVLGADQHDLTLVKHTLDLVVNLEAFDMAGEDYRRFARTVL